ncbi:MAG: 7-carboxy-7-deazaguanine synthase QueE [Candidatus Omnitrophota bacterium]
MVTKANIIEIFSSIQGEGPYVGQRQAFIRFADCNLACSYCDVPKNKKAIRQSCGRIISQIKKLKAQTVSLTGGEPLLQIDFLKILLPKLKSLKFMVYLETNATLPRNLKAILKYVDIIAADIKLPSVTKEKGFWKAHSDFIKVGCKKNIFIKIVVSDKLKMNDFRRGVSLVEKISDKIPLIIQPQTDGKKIKIGINHLRKLQNYALKHLDTVLVIPQVHKALGVR